MGSQEFDLRALSPQNVNCIAHCSYLGAEIDTQSSRQAKLQDLTEQRKLRQDAADRAADRLATGFNPCHVPYSDTEVALQRLALNDNLRSLFFLESAINAIEASTTETNSKINAILTRCPGYILNENTQECRSDIAK